MSYYAHSGQQNDKSDWQKLNDHSISVARLAAEFAAPFGQEQSAHLAGLLHDVGKYTQAFQARLSGSNKPVDHSTAGAAHVLELASKSAEDALSAHCIAYGILGHHAGLPDRLGASGFDERIVRFNEDIERAIDPVWQDELKPDASELFPRDFHIDRDHKHFQTDSVQTGRQHT